MIASLLSRIGIEVWKDIPEYEGLYQVSNLGNVRSLNYRKKGIIKKLSKNLNTNGRYRVGLSKMVNIEVTLNTSTICNGFLIINLVDIK